MYPRYPIRNSGRMGVVPVAAIMTVASLARNIFGRIHGESYAAVEDQSIAGAANAGDWDRVTAIANGGITNGLPYDNSDHHGGWRESERMNWAGPQYAQARQTAQRFLAARNQDVAGRAASQYVTGGGGLPPSTLVYVPTSPASSSPASGNSAADLMRQAIAAGVLDPAILDQVARGALSVADAARVAAASAQGANVGRDVGGGLASISPTVKLVAGLAALGIAVSMMRRR